MTPVPSLITAKAVRRLEARAAELASKAAATATGGLGTAGRETGGAKVLPVVQTAAFAIATTATVDCHEQTISEKLFDAQFKLSKVALAAAPPGNQKPMLEASLHAAVSEFKPNEPKLARVIVDYFMESFDNNHIMGLMADRWLLQLKTNYFLDVIYKERQDTPVAMATFAVATGGACGDAASSPPKAERDTCSRKACKKKRRQRKTTNNAGAAGSQ